jgi:hypothetical protein
MADLGKDVLPKFTIFITPDELENSALGRVSNFVFGLN